MADSYAALAALPLSYPWSCLVLDLKELLPCLSLTDMSSLASSPPMPLYTPTSPRKSTRLNSGMHTSTTLVCVPLMPDYQVEVLPAWLATNYAIGTLYRLMLYSKLPISLSSSHRVLAPLSSLTTPVTTPRNSVGELNFDLFLTSSNNLTATVESNAATEKKPLVLKGSRPCGGVRARMPIGQFSFQHGIW